MDFPVIGSRGRLVFFPTNKLLRSRGFNSHRRGFVLVTMWPLHKLKNFFQ